jgi:hypothetical protein
MDHRPSPILNDEEQELLNDAPEECLRHVIEREALPLDLIIASLSPRVAAAVRSIATGERSAALDVEPGPTREIVDESPARSTADSQLREWTRGMLSNHPQLLRMLDQRFLTAEEAIEATHAIDHILGRYLTGTRYAVP